MQSSSFSPKKRGETSNSPKIGYSQLSSPVKQRESVRRFSSNKLNNFLAVTGSNRRMDSRASVLSFQNETMMSHQSPLKVLSEYSFEESEVSIEQDPLKRF
jgi:hypothetical protein